jgi:tetratricopeptide (TPR) repeat protein
MIACAASTFTLRATERLPLAPVLPGRIGTLHHPIRTRSVEAQRLFDQGLTLYYGFNRDASRRSFERATALDPGAAMPLVGMALALGPNINVDPTSDELRAACASARKAAGLARVAEERAYAEALSVRYCGGNGAPDAAAYVVALESLQRQLTGDVDAKVLYADSLLALRPRSPIQQETLITVLESVLRMHPTHVGANHYYIHAVEDSSTPERALMAAKRLETLVTASGHLLHMPSHIYTRTGAYDASIASNISATAADLAYLRNNPPSADAAMSYMHDLESLAVAAGFAGRLAEATRAAREMNRVEAGLAGQPVERTFTPALAFVLLRFGVWDEVLHLPEAEARELPSVMMFHFARAVASAKVGKTGQADDERRAFQQASRGLTNDETYRGNSTGDVIALFAAVLDARLAADTAVAITAWRRAVAIQDRFAYHEPPPFYYPVRESLGAALIEAARYADAETTFREDLSRNRRNGRSLFGLWHALAAQKREREAERARQVFLRAWSSSDFTLSLLQF